MNHDMPIYVAELAFDALRRAGKSIPDSKIVVFGTAYKGDVDDSRDSPIKEY